MSVEIRFFGILRQITGQNSITVAKPPSKEEQWTVKDVLEEITKQYPKLETELFRENMKAINPLFRLLLNSKEITFKSPLTQTVQIGDILQFFPPVSGGNDNSQKR